MKKRTAFVLMLAMICSLSACGKAAAEPSASPALDEVQPSEKAVELTVFAAASMTETLNQVIELYKSAAPNVTITPTYDSSGTLMTQISEGAECDLFISAARKQMDALDATQAAEKNPDKLDFIDSGTRVNLLENKIVLVVPEGNPANITKFADIANAEMIALGNSDVPVGSYSLEILKYLGLDIAALENAGKVTYGSNVKEVTTQVAESTVDCGIVYATDAFVAGLTVVDTATDDMCKKVIYPAAVLKASKNSEAARAFLDFLKSDKAMSIFEKVGFTKAE
ncbi:MAG: molybdate ABC transporter substrate-binding protein [Oscillospiraceae bacterium]